MANSLSASKRARQAEKNRRRNASQRSHVRTAIKRVLRAIQSRDKAAAEVCPVWPGQPMTAHWGVADPAAVEGDDLGRKAAFHNAFAELKNRISIFVNLPIESLDKIRLQHEFDEIGRTHAAPDSGGPTARGLSRLVSAESPHR